MYKHKFGKKSLIQLSTCHVDLQLLAMESLQRSPIDFGIREGQRTEAKQIEYFEKGWSTIDPRKGGTSKHMKSPSMAFDFKIFVPSSIKPEKYKDKDFTFEIEHLTYVAGIITTTAQFLYEKGSMAHKVRWGGNWDDDGIILYDHTLWDRPHIELI